MIVPSDLLIQPLDFVPFDIVNSTDFLMFFFVPRKEEEQVEIYVLFIDNKVYWQKKLIEDFSRFRSLIKVPFIQFNQFIYFGL